MDQIQTSPTSASFVVRLGSSSSISSIKKKNKMKKEKNNRYLQLENAKKEEAGFIKEPARGKTNSARNKIRQQQPPSSPLSSPRANIDKILSRCSKGDADKKPNSLGAKESSRLHKRDHD
eukprot:jgi/Bigna1/141868/aug1.65_g16576